MKTIFNYSKTFMLFTMVLLIGCTLHAQNGSNYLTVSGVVKNKVTNKKLEFVGVSVSGTNISTITNEDGEFSLKISSSTDAKTIELFYVGYDNLRIPINGEDMLGKTFYLVPSQSIILPAATAVSWEDPSELVRLALKKVSKNYSTTPNLLTGFYRETIKKRRTYINITEAIVHIHKTAYANNDVSRDEVFIDKGRKIISQNKNDTLAVKLMGGPNLAVYMDIVKNPENLFDMESLTDYKFRMGEATLFNDRQQYVVHFEPLSILPYPLFYGTAYIDQQTLAFTRVTFSMDMRDRNKTVSSLLVKKPAGLRFKPEEVSFIVAYKQLGDKTFLHYIRNEIKFQCDWKRKLFSTNYSVISEMVITDNKPFNKTDIAGKKAFKTKDMLNDKVSNFYDENFWGAYNIIEPTESLESAVNKLKKQQK